MQKHRVVTEGWRLYSLPLSQTNGLGRELSPRGGRMGSPGNEAKISSKRNKMKRRYASCSACRRMLVPVATGPRAGSGWPRQGQQAPSISVCAQGLGYQE